MSVRHRHNAAIRLAPIANSTPWARHSRARSRAKYPGSTRTRAGAQFACGVLAFVWHELVSDLVHLDVHVAEPTPARPYYTVVTSGMSDRP